MTIDQFLKYVDQLSFTKWQTRINEFGQIRLRKKTINPFKTYEYNIVTAVAADLFPDIKFPYYNNEKDVFRSNTFLILPQEDFNKVVVSSEGYFWLEEFDYQIRLSILDSLNLNPRYNEELSEIFFLNKKPE